jgi:hypothetical protein
MQRTLLLARTFFARFFESDLLPPGLPQEQFVIWSLVLVATPGLLLPMRLASDLLIADESGASLVRPFLIHRLLFISLTMTALGLVALITWDGVFPDRRDARILGVLPVSGGVQVGARLLALGTLCGLFVLGANAIPTLVYGPVMGAFGGAVSSIRGALAHGLATTAAAVFVFSALVALQGIALNIGGRRAADRLSLVMQVLFVLALLQMILFLPRVAAALPTDLDSGLARMLPSVWFLGLYDVLGGKPAAGAPVLAATAVVATTAAVGTSIGLFLTTHARLMRRALESKDVARRGQFMTRAAAAITRALCRTTAARATFEMTLRTMARSRSHRLLMSAYVGVALAFIASGIVPLFLRRGWASFDTPSLEALAAPLMLSFFTLVGMRVAIAIPVEPRASWAVRIAEPPDRVSLVSGARAAMILVGVGPSVVLAFVSAMFFWGVVPAALHTFVCLALGLLLTEILLIGFIKIPFACTYLPGKSKIGTLWPLYVSGFITYTLSPATFELALLRRPLAMPLIVFTTLTIGTSVLLAVIRRRRLRALPGLIYQEEDPASLFRGFQLSEGFAAATEETRQLR